MNLNDVILRYLLYYIYIYMGVCVLNILIVNIFLQTLKLILNIMISSKVTTSQSIGVFLSSDMFCCITG